MIISKFKKTWSEYPHTFWILVASTFIDRLGREVKRLEYGKTGNLDLTLKLPAKAESLTPTLFQEWGFWGIIPLWLLYFIFHTILIKLKYD